MAQYNKAIVALIAAVISLLTSVGVTIPESATNFVNSAVPFVAAILVYFIPNKTLSE